MREKRGLGKGLDLLLPGSQITPQAADVVHLDLTVIHPNPDQPRRDFSPQALEELCLSIKNDGVLQPILVRPHKEKNNMYEIVAGERRWRAAGQAGLKKIPALVRKIDDEQALALALIENLQREDLNPVEEAQALQTLRERFGFSQEQLAQKVGKSRSALANSLRLLQLSAQVMEELRQGRISSGHARALLALEDGAEQERICAQIIQNGYNVRQTEKLVARLKKTAASTPKPMPSFQAELTQKLRACLPCPVKVKGTAKKGSISLHYSSPEELARLESLLQGQTMFPANRP